MHLLITDSGVGGLSVCAYAERFARTAGLTGPIRLTYVNASPENDFGYNSMGSRREKLEFFDRFLHIIAERFEPDLIDVACNTLSVLLPDTDFFAERSIPVRGIVDSGVVRLADVLEHQPGSKVALFGTVTTIEEGTFTRRLVERGILRDRIIDQACPSLADTISEDRRGSAVMTKVRRYVAEVLDRLGGNPGEGPLLIYLACTHYGYRKDHFIEAFRERGLETVLLNPNEFVAEEILGPLEASSGDAGAGQPIDVRFISRYRIPETALETISFFLEPVSPATVAAFRNYSHQPDLF